MLVLYFYKLEHNYLILDQNGHCNRQGKRGHYTNTEALGPYIEEGAVNRRPLQALFLLPWGGAGPAPAPAPYSYMLRNT